MVRMACVNVPALALQILVHTYPEWRELPIAVVTEDKPLGTIIQINKRARDAGIKVGMRYAAALAVEPYLRAGAVSEGDIQRGTESILEALFQFSPEIEPFALLPGVFWVNADGLNRIYGSLSKWVGALQGALGEAGLRSRVCVGFNRFGSFAGAKLSLQPLIFSSVEEEEVFSRNAPLSILPMNPKTFTQLKDLGIDTVGAFLDLPGGGVKKRFHKEIAEWHRFASGELTHPLQPTQRREELVLYKRYLHPAKDVRTVMHHVEELLDHLLADVMKHNELVHTLRLVQLTEDGERCVDEVSPARPTVQYEMLARLIWLRLEKAVTSSGIIVLELSADRVEAKGAQQQLFNTHVERNLQAGAEAFALIRAELGNDAVQVASLKSVHVPEEQFEWKNVHRPVLAHLETGGEGGEATSRGHRDGVRTESSSDDVGDVGLSRLVRRIYRTPIPLYRKRVGRAPRVGVPTLGSPSHGEGDVPTLGTPSHVPPGRGLPALDSPSHVPPGRGLHRGGPYTISAGWWEDEIQRDYHFVETPDGAILWVFFDRQQERWMVQGSA